jgi:hypothetical protein
VLSLNQRALDGVQLLFAHKIISTKTQPTNATRTVTLQKHMLNTQQMSRFLRNVICGMPALRME